MGLEADDWRMGGGVSISTEGGEVLSSAENILTSLPYSMHLLQELCREKRKKTQSSGMQKKTVIHSIKCQKNLIYVNSFVVELVVF